MKHFTGCQLCWENMQISQRETGNILHSLANPLLALLAQELLFENIDISLV
jgi:hypothetical protein